MREVVVRMDDDERIALLEREVGRLTIDVRARDRLILQLTQDLPADGEADEDENEASVPEVHEKPIRLARRRQAPAEAPPEDSPPAA